MNFKETPNKENPKLIVKTQTAKMDNETIEKVLYGGNKMGRKPNRERSLTISFRCSESFFKKYLKDLTNRTETIKKTIKIHHDSRLIEHELNEIYMHINDVIVNGESDEESVELLKQCMRILQAIKNKHNL